MNSSILRRRGASRTASETRVTVSSTHSPHRQRPSPPSSRLHGNLVDSVLQSRCLIALTRRRAVGGEVLRRVDATRRDERTEVVGSERLDGGDGDLLRQDRRALVGDRAIHQDDDQPPFLLHRLDSWRRPAGASFAHTGSVARARAGDVDGREGADRSRDAVLQHGEVRGAQPAHRLPLVVEDGDIELDELDAGSKRGLVAPVLSEERGGRPGGKPGKNDVKETRSKAVQPIRRMI